MPYLSIAHYKAGEPVEINGIKTKGKNVPGTVEAIYVDGNKLKSKGTLDDTPLGRQVFESLCDDLYRKKSGDTEHLPVRISIGFLDLEHKHVAQQGGQEFLFTRSALGQICPLCEQGIGGKIYLKGQLVHLALTRVPVNTRTEMIAEKSMTEIIQTKKDDAKSIIKELADELDERSLAEGTLVVRSESEESVPVKATVETNPLDEVLRSIANFYKSQGITPVVEASMPKEVETVEKMQLGGESVPHKKFEYEGIDGDPGNNITAAPIPVKAKVEMEKEEDEEKEEVKKSVLDTEYEQLKSLLESGATTEEINAKFASFASVAEKSYTPKNESVDMSNIASMLEAAVQRAITPLKVELAQIRAERIDMVSKARNEVPNSRSLKLRPEDFLQKSVPSNVPQRKLTQIEMLARKSTGAYVPEQ
jgi:hypothetical protein